MNLNLVTFNIRCFGFDGDYFGRQKRESRTLFIKKFLEQNYSDTDCYIFQEIMNPLILDKILPKNFQIYTYQHEYARHMYVAFACREPLRIDNFQTIDNTAVDDKKSRPAVYGQLIAENKSKINLIGLHLKSKYQYTELRKKQCHAIANFLGKQTNSAHTIIAGDFNSHTKNKTFQKKDDISYLQDILSPTVHWVQNTTPTYLTENEDITLDHFFVSDHLKPKLSVYNLEEYAEYGAYRKYFDQISDHLPVKISTEI